MKQNKLFKSNTFVVNLSVCVLVLLVMCYFGINTPVRKTYSASGPSGATCGTGKVVVDAFDYEGYNVDYSAQYCCPPGSHWEDGYCVAAEYNIEHVDGATGYQCVKEVTDDNFWRFDLDNVCPDMLGDGWSTVPGSCAYTESTFYATCKCYHEKSICATDLVDPTYPDGACFFKRGIGYVWDTTVKDYYVMNATARTATTESACQKLDTDYKSSLFQCFVDDKNDTDATNDRYVWSDDEDYYIGLDYSYAKDLTTEKDCIKRNQYKVNYTATGATNVPSTGTKFGGINLNVSQQIPAKTGAKFLGWNSTSSKKIDYNPNDVLTSDKNYYLNAVWKLEGIKSVKKYNYVNGRNTILNVPEVTSVSTFKSNFTMNSGFVLSVNDYKNVAGNLALYTGAKITVTDNGATIGNYDIWNDEEYTVVVNGDIDGDGKLTTKDYIKLYRHLSKSYVDKLTDVYLLASDYDSSGSEDTKDYVAMYNYLKDKYDPN